MWYRKPLRRFKRDDEERACIALMVTRLAPEKDFSTALDALAQTVDRGAPLGLVIVGEGE